MTYLVEIIRPVLLRLLGLEVSFHQLWLWQCWSVCLSVCLLCSAQYTIFVLETNKFHYFDEYFNLLLRDADSGGEELLVNNITVVSLSWFHKYLFEMKRICSFQKIFFTQLFVPATRFDYYSAVCSRCWNNGHVRRSSLHSDVLRQCCGEMSSVSAPFKCDNVDFRETERGQCFIFSIQKCGISWMNKLCENCLKKLK